MSEEKQESRSRQGEEFRGKTIEAAVSAGLAALRVTRDQVEVEVVRPGSRGVLGIGAEDAIVRLTASPASETQQAAGKASVPTSEPKAQGGPSRPPATTGGQKQTPSKSVKQREGAEGVRRGERAPKSPSEPQKHAEPSTTPALPKEEAVGASEDRSAAAAMRGQELLQGLVDRMNLRAHVEVVAQSDAEADEGEGVQVLNIVGEDLGVLIGRQNEVLSALELITRLMANQSVHGRSDFIVDVNGYRAKRAESLRKLALRMADQVIETGRTAVLEPMPPAERRIIHLALRSHPKVITQSIGEGDRRKVTIVPKRD
jgi:spoIIIJ-associated protein